MAQIYPATDAFSTRQDILSSSLGVPRGSDYWSCVLDFWKRCLDLVGLIVSANADRTYSVHGEPASSLAPMCSCPSRPKGAIMDHHPLECGKCRSDTIRWLARFVFRNTASLPDRRTTRCAPYGPFTLLTHTRAVVGFSRKRPPPGDVHAIFAFHLVSRPARAHRRFRSGDGRAVYCYLRIRRQSFGCRQ
jgi:hypothetical protein